LCYGHLVMYLFLRVV